MILWNANEIFLDFQIHGYRIAFFQPLTSERAGGARVYLFLRICVFVFLYFCIFVFLYLWQLAGGNSGSGRGNSGQENVARRGISSMLRTNRCPFLSSNHHWPGSWHESDRALCHQDQDRLLEEEQQRCIRKILDALDAKSSIFREKSVIDD